MTDLADAPEDLRERIQSIAEKTGFVPNVFLALLHRPGELRAFMDYHDAVMEQPSGLSKAEREMIVVATSAAWDCPYCVVAHGAILRIRTKDARLPDYLATNYRAADVAPRQRAMLDYALKLSTAPQTVEEADRAALRDEHGFSDDDIWDIGSVTALFGLSNRLAHMADIRPNPEFHTLGR
ncbi:MAG: hypothetical protein QOF76_3930 [Solirubrobacteraceae bacterium]|jgi:uncharacterized peroxidase-related enzyme|nr:hypothetical protein [Solirubrobacteraceae bacterium]